MSQLLVAIRGARTQAEAAAAAGFSQAKISRAERGRYPLTPDEADRYAGELRAPADLRRRLVELAEARAGDQGTGRVALVRVAAAIQERIERLQQDATLIRAWQPIMVPGVLQTRAYTTALLAGDGGGEPGDAWWAARAARVAMLVEPGRTWHLLMSEAALHWQLGSTATVAAQIEHLVEASRQPNVLLGIVPFAAPKQFAPPSAFHMYDEVASVATEIGTSFVTDEQDVAHFTALFGRLDELAVHGDAARELLARVAGR